MSYSYETEKPHLFTDTGQREFLAIRDHAQRLLATAGAVRMDKITAAPNSPAAIWRCMACVDRMVELGELREVTAGTDVRGQDRVFVSARDGA